MRLSPVPSFAFRRIALVSRFRNSLHLISAPYEFRNRKDTSQTIDAGVVLVSKFANDADIGDTANFETTTLELRRTSRSHVSITPCFVERGSLCRHRFFYRSVHIHPVAEVLPLLPSRQ